MILKDTLGRPINDLRISVTDRCNLRCNYCMPSEKYGFRYKFAKVAEVLSFDEIVKICKTFVPLGVNKLRITGGEPLLRKDLVSLIERLSEIDDSIDLAMTTNATMLSKYAKELKKAGLKRLNISLDVADKNTFIKMNDRDRFEQVLEGIEAAREAGFSPLKINAVIRKGDNEDQILPLARLFKRSKDVLRYIEFMDVGTLNKWSMKEVVSIKEIVNTLKSEFDLDEISGLDGVARYLRYRDTGGTVGVIASVTKPFCSSCNRARITADGKLMTCLFTNTGLDIKTLLRTGVSDEQLKAILVDYWSKRSDRYSEVRQDLLKKKGSKGTKEGAKVEMYKVGG